MPADPGGGARPRWAALIPATIGFGVAVYLTVEHYTSSGTLACPDTGAINCTKVTTSSYAQVFGFPVALAGALYFAAMTLLVTPAAWRIRALNSLRLTAAAAGVVAACYLIGVELFAVDAFCLWCTGAHLCAVALFAAVLWYVLADRAD